MERDVTNARIVPVRVGAHMFAGIEWDGVTLLADRWASDVPQVLDPDRRLLVVSRERFAEYLDELALQPVWTKGCRI